MEQRTNDFGEKHSDGSLMRKYMGPHMISPPMTPLYNIEDQFLSQMPVILALYSNATSMIVFSTAVRCRRWQYAVPSRKTSYLRFLLLLLRRGSPHQFIQQYDTVIGHIATLAAFLKGTVLS